LTDFELALQLIMARKISLTVKANARRSGVEKISDTEFSVTVRAPARDGAANRAVIEALSIFLAIPKSTLRIVRGHAARKKLIEID
jgi:uncharacterized protein (TIGR00251 family)